MGDDAIYMEIDKYNSMDEIAPYSENTSNAYEMITMEKSIVFLLEYQLNPNQT